MTNLTAGLANPHAVDMTAWNLTPLQTGTIVAYDSDSITIRAGNQTWHLTGHDFAYAIDGGDVQLDAGTITGISGISASPTATPHPKPTPAFSHDYTLSDFSLDVHDFNAYIAANDVRGYERALFAGNDHLQGGNHDDHLIGMQGKDHLIGGGGDDWLEGRRGADVLAGGAGADTMFGGKGRDVFVFHSAADSGGGIYDSVDFHTGNDLLIVPHAVTGIDHHQDAGTSNSMNVDANLEAAFGKHQLDAHHAAVATVEIDFSESDNGGVGHPLILLETFLVVDVNGVAGYQAGEDLAIRISGFNNLAHLSTDDFLAPSISG